MDLQDLPPKDGAQRAYCDVCEGSLGLTFARFHESVSGVEIDMDGLPTLECPACGFRTLPDRTCFAIMRAHEIATKQGNPVFRSKRRKLTDRFEYTDIPFQYDPDDYYYYPGLERPWNTGFLTPVFFNRTVLTKYDADPRYLVSYASPTYGDIRYLDDFSFPFGINRHGRLVMWLGDIAKLPKPEQYYLMSENLPSDHSLGSEFYDAQIQSKYTEPPRESVLFKARSDFLAAVFDHWKEKAAHLDAEVLELAQTLRQPIHDTPTQRRTTADILNKVHLESLDNVKLGKLIGSHGLVSKGTGSLKRLQVLLESVIDADRVYDLMSPFYTLADFRVASSHLTSAEAAAETMKKVTGRLGLAEDAPLAEIYDQLIERMRASYEALKASLDAANAKAEIP